VPEEELKATLNVTTIIMITIFRHLVIAVYRLELFESYCYLGVIFNRYTMMSNWKEK